MSGPGALSTPGPWSNTMEVPDMAERTCSVENCDRQAKVHGVCPMHYKRHCKHGSYDRQMPSTICIVPGCTKKPSGGLCSMHRTRMQRTGTYDERPQRVGIISADRSTGYLRITVPKSHPLARGSTTAQWMHRVILFDAIGYGPHRCHWCGAYINWRAGLEVDHLDETTQNNAIENLVPSCHSCNIRRGWAHSPHRKTS